MMAQVLFFSTGDQIPQKQQLLLLLVVVNVLFQLAGLSFQVYLAPDPFKVFLIYTI